MRKLKWVRSAGGPLLLLPVALRHHWSGINPSKDPLNDARFRWDWGMTVPSDYDRACDVSGLLAALQVGAGHGLVLGDEPLSTVWVPFDGEPGGLLVRWVYGDKEADVQEAIGDLAVERFRPSGLVFRHTGRTAVLFDSAIPGPELYTWKGEDHLFRFHLQPHEYAVSTTEYEPTMNLRVIAHRLSVAPVGSPPRRTRS